MKKILFLSAFCLTIQICFAQGSVKAGLTVEGGYLFPKNKSAVGDLKSGYMAGTGIWLMKDLHRYFSADLGLTFRQKKFRQFRQGSYDPYSASQKESEPDRTIDFQQDLLAIPLHVRVYPSKKFFLSAGIEHAFILNPKVDLKKKSEDNWILGIGGQPSKLNWVLTYSQGFQKRQSVEIIEDSRYWANYTNRIIQLSLFYPIWQKK